MTDLRPDQTVVPIVSLAPKPFVVLKDIPALITAKLAANSDESDATDEIEFTADFEAGVGSSGDSVEEAVKNLKDRLVAKFTILDSTPPEKLGRIPKQQLAVLRTVMARADQWHDEAARTSPRN